MLNVILNKIFQFKFSNLIRKSRIDICLFVKFNLIRHTEEKHPVLLLVYLLRWMAAHLVIFASLVLIEHIDE